MQRLRSIIFITILSALTATGQDSSTNFTGKLDAQLAVDRVHIYQRVLSIVDRSKLTFESKPDKGAVISAG